MDMAKGKLVLSDEQVVEIGLGVSEHGVRHYADKFNVPISSVRSVIASLRNTGLALKLPEKKGKYGRYATLADKIKS